MNVITDRLLMDCLSCGQTVSASEKSEHQNFHKALKALKYKQVGNAPRTLDILLKRRRVILKKLMVKHNIERHDSDLSSRIERLDEAFEVLRSEIIRGKSVSNSLCPFIEKVKAKDGGLTIDDKEKMEDIKSDFVCENLPHCVASIGTSHAMNIQHRDSMEDRTTVVPQLVSLEKSRNRESPGSCFIGLYDGYCGSTAAGQAGQTFHQLLQEEIGKEKSHFFNNPVTLNRNNIDEVQAENAMITEDTNYEKESSSSKEDRTNLLPYSRILRGCKKAYKAMDEQLSWGIDETSRVRWSGCSVASCLITDEKEESCTESKSKEAATGNTENESTEDCRYSNGRIFVSNAGNVSAYICHLGKPYRLTQCHTVRNKEECARVVQTGGQIIGSGNYTTVNGVLATTRGLGNHGDPALKKSVTFEPFTSTAPITRDTQFVVVATESVWSLFKPQEVFDMINRTKLFDISHLSLIDDSDSQSDVSLLPHLVEPGQPSEEDILFKVEHQKRDEDNALPSIAETEEERQEGIEEVVIVRRKREEYDDEESSSTSASHTYHLFHAYDPNKEDATLEEVSHSEESEKFPGRLAELMTEKLVRAAIAAGSTENVSAAVILFQGFFD